MRSTAKKALAALAVAVATAAPASSEVRDAWPYVKSGCLPAEIRSALAAISRQFGRDVLIVSAHRAKASPMHRSCRAADFRMPGVNRTVIRDFAKGLPGVRGIGTYPGKDIVHIDNRPIPFAWWR